MSDEISAATLKVSHAAYGEPEENGENRRIKYCNDHLAQRPINQLRGMSIT